MEDYYTPNQADIDKLQLKHKKRLKFLIKELNSLLKEVQSDFPNAEYYLEDCGNFMLMSGPTHTGLSCVPRRDRVLQCEKLNRSGGGGW